MKRIFTFAFLLMLLNLHAQYGMLDTTFNGTGQNGSQFLGDAAVGQILLLPEGKILFLGPANDNVFAGNHYVGAIRLNADGTFDTTFGEGGAVKLTINYAGSTYWSGAMMAPDGNIFIRSQYSNFTLAKFTPDLIPINTFGTDGKIAITYGNDYYSTGTDFLSDGSFYVKGASKVAGSGIFSAHIRKYSAEGVLDTSFGSAGTVVFSLADIADNYLGGVVYRLNDGKYLVVGNHRFLVGANEYANLFMKKFNADGTVDTSFGTGGKVLTDQIASANQVKFNEDGSILIWGNPMTWTGTPQAGIKSVKFNNNGSLADEPNIYFDSGVTNSVLSSFHFQEDGKVLLVGSYTESSVPNGTNSYFVRRNADGTYDTTFGTNGKFLPSFSNGSDGVGQILFAPDGKIVFGGKRIVNGHWEFLMGRLTSGIVLGSIDNSVFKSAKLYPNPATDKVFMEYELKEPSTVAIKVYDLTGKIVYSDMPNARTAGIQREELNTSGFAKGIYLAVISSDGIKKHSIKFIIE